MSHTEKILREKVIRLSHDIHPDIIKMRRHLHAYPELSFQEQMTSAFIKSELNAMDIPWTAVAGTGVVGMVEGQLASDRVIALRADIDALPVQEKNNVSYTSQHPGVMHACGHDFHTSSLLGTAKILQSMKGTFGGKVKLIFQPGEEVLPGGASIMIKEGVLDKPKPEAIIGQHAMPRIKSGTI
jgi:amidohydrolase